jgi:hypothetical protein
MQTGLCVFAGPAEAAAIGNLSAQLIADREFSNQWEIRDMVSRSISIGEYHAPIGTRSGMRRSQDSKAYCRNMFMMNLLNTRSGTAAEGVRTHTYRFETALYTEPAIRSGI